MSVLGSTDKYDVAEMWGGGCGGARELRVTDNSAVCACSTVSCAGNGSETGLRALILG